MKMPTITRADWVLFSKSLPWVFVSSVVLGYFLFSVELGGWIEVTIGQFSYSEEVIALCVLIAVIWFLDFIFNLLDELRKQKIRNQPSWIYYGFLSIALSPLLASFLLLYKFPIHTANYLFLNEIIFNCVFSFFFTLLLFLIPKGSLSGGMRFAAGSVGIADDKLDFKDSVGNVAQSLSEIKKYVSVVALYGGLGFGKSSYARMIIESFDKNDTLYSYISLTETNEAKDFSKLFAERWLATLKERYPKIDTSAVMPLMQSILREYGNGFLSSLFSLIPGLDKGLIKTKAKFFDEFYKPNKNAKTSTEVARLFGNIPDVKESIWIITIDEVERAQFDEIYRFVEIIERFKNEGRTGLPIKIMFLLCISDPNFEQLLKELRATDPRAHLINTFFYQDPKSVTQTLFLPPVSPDKKKDYILQQLRVLDDENNLGLGSKLDGLYFDSFSDPSREFFSDHLKALSYVLGLFSTASPRVISRCTQGVVFFYNAFRNKSGELQKTSIRLSDLLIAEYLKIKYPYLITFFENTVGLLLAEYQEAGGGMTYGGMAAYLKREAFKKNQTTLVAWVEEVTGVKIPEAEKKHVSDMIALVCYSYVDYSNVSKNQMNADLYSNSLALPKNLYDYLSVVSDAVVTSFDRYNQIYLRHKDSKIDLATLADSELAGYARYVYDISAAPIKLDIALINEIGRRLVDGLIQIEAGNIGDTVYDALLYQFVFQIVVVSEKDRKSAELPSAELKIAYEKLHAVLASPKVTTGGKYLMLNSLANNTRGSGSEVHMRLESALKVLLKYWKNDFVQVVGHVFKEADERYYDGKEIIYEHEENFFFTMYQSWSGNHQASSEINKIRAVARRGLENHPDVLAYYWNRYKFNPDWVDLNDILRYDPFFTGEPNFELYMPLEELIDVTTKAKIDDPDIMAKKEFWEKIYNSERYKQLAIIKDDPTTLKAVLTSRGFHI